MDRSPTSAASAEPAPDASCPHCGTPREPDASFCIQCGRRLAAGPGGSLASALFSRAGPAPGETPEAPQSAPEAASPAWPPAAPPAPALPALEPGDRLGGGRYLVGPALGERGAERLYEATDLQVDAPVVLHGLDPRRLEPDSLARVRSRIAALRSLHHPGVVRVEDAGRHGEIDFFVTERVDGPTLEEALAGRVESFSLLEAARLVVPLLDALGHLHPQVVLGTLAPRRVVLAGGDPSQPKLEVPALVPGPEQAGDEAYRAPEQVRRRGADARADLYAVGVLLYRLLTGELPGPDSARPSALRPRLPAGIDRLIAALLQRSPDQRPGSAAEVRAELLALCARERRRRRRAPGWLVEHGRAAAMAAGLIAFAALAGVLAVEANRRSAARGPEPPPPVAAVPQPTPPVGAPPPAEPDTARLPETLASPPAPAPPEAGAGTPTGPGPGEADEEGTVARTPLPAAEETPAAAGAAATAPSPSELEQELGAASPSAPTTTAGEPAPTGSEAPAAVAALPLAHDEPADAAPAAEPSAEQADREAAVREAEARERALDEAYRTQWTPQMREAALAAQREWQARAEEGALETSPESARAEAALERARILDGEGRAREAWSAYVEALDEYQAVLGDLP